MQKTYTWERRDIEWIKNNPGKPYMYKVDSEGEVDPQPKLKEIYHTRTTVVPKKRTPKTLPTSGIYAIICEPEKHVYVGQSINIPTRIRNHRMCIVRQWADKDRMYSKMKEHYEKYGIEGFEFATHTPMPNATQAELIYTENKTMIEFINKGYQLYNRAVTINVGAEIIYCPTEIQSTLIPLIKAAQRNPELLEKIRALIN